MTAVADKVRRTWLRTFAARTTPPKGAAQWVALTVAHGDHGVRRAMEDGHALARDLLTGDTTEPAYGRLHPVLADTLTGASDACAAVISLFPAAQRPRTGHRHPVLAQPQRRHRPIPHLPHLPRHTLSEVEQKAAGQDPLPHSEPTGEATD